MITIMNQQGILDNHPENLILPYIRFIHYIIMVRKKKKYYFQTEFNISNTLAVTTVATSDDPWVIRSSLSQLLSKISGNDLTRDGHHHHHHYHSILIFIQLHNNKQLGCDQNKQSILIQHEFNLKILFVIFHYLKVEHQNKNLNVNHFDLISQSILLCFFILVMFMLYDEDSNGILDKQV